MDIVQEKTKEDPLKMFEAMDNVRPMVETKSRRVGGAYQVPVEVEFRCARFRSAPAGSLNTPRSAAERR